MRRGPHGYAALASFFFGAEAPDGVDGVEAGAVELEPASDPDEDFAEAVSEADAGAPDDGSEPDADFAAADSEAAGLRESFT
ncbi:MAG TPA: hypothetical protein VGD01_08845 [Candidatus Elarobacter sp.]